MTKDQTTVIIQEHRRHDMDRGSPEVQVALLTARINELTQHMRLHRKDHHSRHGLLNMVARRRRLLTYLKRTDPDRYTGLLRQLGLKK